MAGTAAAYLGWERILQALGIHGPDRPGCTPAAGPPPDDCGGYAAHSDWLPDAYVTNATCACETTPDQDTSNCVRGLLQEALTDIRPDLRHEALTRKRQLRDDGDRIRYDEWVVEHLTPVIYQWHRAAYESCCCTHGPAPYDDWIGVTTVEIRDCAVIEEAIDVFGSCHGTPGRW
ncbi:MAG: hypothetical protein R3190_01760 [Thermoanaerobaculia bacterium]|nr:hypothetical protein [Thermoanaerobaculia bacterium]